MGLVLALAFLFASCQGEIPTSHSSDQELYGAGAIVGSTEFVAAYNLLKDKCISCHSGYHASWAQLITSADWVAANLVQENNPNGSRVYTKLKLVGGNMPPDGSGISFTPADAVILRNWINSL